MSEREAFEAWAVNQHWFKDLNDPANGLARYTWSDGRDFYKVRDIECMWNGWNARAAIDAAIAQEQPNARANARP